MLVNLYIIKNDINNLVYIGQTSESIQRRFAKHIADALYKDFNTHLIKPKNDNTQLLNNKKRNEVYNAIGEYIICLEDSLEREQDYYERAEIKKEIQQLKMEQEKYFVPSMLNQKNVKENNIKIKKKNK